MSAFFAILVIFLLSLGQLQRFSLTPHLAFYWHDVAVMIFLLITTFLKRQAIIAKLTKIWQHSHHHLPIFFTAIFIFAITIFSWIFHQISFVPILYTLRLGAYIFFVYYIFAFEILPLRQLQSALLGSLSIFLIAGFIQYFTFPDAYWLKFLGWDEHYHRLFSTLLDPNFVGIILVLPIISILVTQRFKVHNIIFLALFLTALLLTYSRASYLALITSFILWFVQKLHQQKKFDWQKFWRPAMILTAVFVLALVIFSTRPSTHSDSTNLLRTNSIAVRAQMAFTQLQDLRGLDSLIGRGLFVALPSSTTRQFMTQFTIVTAAFPDNLFILLISFFGLPVTVLLLYWLVKILRFTAKKNFTIFLMLVAVLIHSQFNNTILQPFVCLYLGLFIVMILNNSRTKRSGQKGTHVTNLGANQKS